VPELPEVETIRRQLEMHVIGREVVDADAHESAKFSSALEAIGSTIRGVSRRGKYLVFGLDDNGAADEGAADGRELVVHLGMTGTLALDDTQDPYVRARWRLDDGTTLRYRDIRRFGRIAVVKAGDYSALPTLATQGPDPFDDDFTPDHLWRSIRRSRTRVKTQLLSQRPVAGVGNIYADEALWRAGIDPARRSITRAEAELLHLALREVLAQGISNGGTTLRDYRAFDGGEGSNQHALDCYGRHDQPCNRCGALLVRRVLDARGTTHCPRCQPNRSQPNRSQPNRSEPTRSARASG
jgi:formamidopyrimidine-DNA glycosylase